MVYLLMFVVLIQKALVTIGQSEDQIGKDFLLKDFPSIYSRKFEEYKRSHRNVTLPERKFSYSALGYSGEGEAKDGKIIDISPLIMKNFDVVKEDTGVSITFHFEIPRFVISYDLVIKDKLGKGTATVLLNLQNAILSVYSVAEQENGGCSMNSPLARITLQPGKFDYQLEDLEVVTRYLFWPPVDLIKSAARSIVWIYMKSEDAELLINVESLINRGFIGPAVVEPWKMAVTEAGGSGHDLCQDVLRHESKKDQR